MVRQAVFTTIVWGHRGALVQAVWVPTGVLQEEVVDSIGTINGDTKAAPPILTNVTLHAERKAKRSHARGMLGFQRRRQSDALLERLTPRNGVTPST